MGSLKNKTVIYDGDSICECRFDGQADNGGSYPKIISNQTASTFRNFAVGGGTLSSQINRPEFPWGGKHHSVCDNISKLPKDGNLYCFEGGVNDYWQNFELGSFDPNDYTGDLDTETVSGALEYIFRYAIDNFLGIPICFVIVHKISEYVEGKKIADISSKKNNAKIPYDFNECHDRLVAICKKYSIPYYDAYENSGLNGWNQIQNNTFLTAGSSCILGRGDGCHPNAEAYRRYYVPQLIALFESIMPLSKA